MCTGYQVRRRVTQRSPVSRTPRHPHPGASSHTHKLSWPAKSTIIHTNYRLSRYIHIACAQPNAAQAQGTQAAHISHRPHTRQRTLACTAPRHLHAPPPCTDKRHLHAYAHHGICTDKRHLRTQQHTHARVSSRALTPLSLHSHASRMQCG